MTTADPNILCLLLLIARLGDVGTTWLATPKLLLEGNPIVRRLGWRYAFATIALCLLPYFSENLAIVVLVMSLLVAAENAAKVWIVQAMGEEAALKRQLEIARKSTITSAMACVAASAFFLVLLGVTIIMVTNNSGFLVGIGVIAYAQMILLFGSLHVARLFRKAHGPVIYF